MTELTWTVIDWQAQWAGAPSCQCAVLSARLNYTKWL